MSSVTALATVTVTTTASAATASASGGGSRAPHQGGILEHANPSTYDPKNPITVFIIQAAIILIACRLLHFPLSKIRQPKVIAEIIGGIVLGPSVMGRIPGFSKAIFPAESIPNLNLAANLGLVLYLFLIGLEVDVRFLVSNWKIATSVGAVGMALPFGLGCGIAWGLYNQFANETDPISFGIYLLFIGVALAITAFPVLCRILTELKLLNTPVGVIVLSAGVGNDVVGWILLALCVALVNAGSGLTALWVLLVAVGYVLFLCYAVRPAFRWLLERTGSIQNGPTQGVVGITILLVLASSFFTNIIGIHAIFGAFVIGLICPHEGGFAIKLTEKIEDLVAALFLPLYFALSGLNTNLGLLDGGITWAYVIGVTAIAFIGKITGGTLAARLNGLVWRESFTIGALMSCKGLVELIVLNIGLQARILSTRTFTIFVVMALVTTFATTPMVSALYPPWYQIKLEAWKRGEIDWDGNKLNQDGLPESDGGSAVEKGEKTEVNKLLALCRLDNMPGILSFVSLLMKPATSTEPQVHPSKRGEPDEDEDIVSIRKRPFQIHGVRLRELTERDSSVMQVTEPEELTLRDPVLNTLRTFGQLRNVAVAGSVLVAPESSFAPTLSERSSDVAADLVLIPWSETGHMSEIESPLVQSANKFHDGSFSSFVVKSLRKNPRPVAVLVDNGFGSKRRRERPHLFRSVSAMSNREMRTHTTVPLLNQGHHILFPFFGSEDDKIALRLVLQLAQNTTVTATIIHFELPSDLTAKITEAAITKLPKTPGLPPATPSGTEVAIKSPTSAVIPMAAASNYATLFRTVRDSLPSELQSRVVFETFQSSAPLKDVLEKAKLEVGQNPRNAGDLVVLGRNSPMNRVFSGENESWAASEAGKSLGAIAGAIVKAQLNTSLLVLKAAKDYK